MRKFWIVAAVSVLWCAAANAQKPPLLPEKDVSALARELSGETAKRNLEGISQFHRQRGSKGFHQAAELVADRLRAYGLSNVTILQFPADGKIFYGTQRSRPAWDAEVGELTELGGTNPKIIASFKNEPVALAEDSESADVTANLIDVGDGTKGPDYTSKDVRGKIVLVGAQPGAVQDLAVGKYGAVGILSYAQNQKTAWSGDNREQVRWGHLDTFSPNKTFGFMVSLNEASALKDRLAKGESIGLHAVVKAGQHPGNYEVVTATIPGSEGKLKEEEIAFSCHLDHQHPGANDNASGCAAILEVARTLQKLIEDGQLAPPARTIRFIFPPEIEGTLALLNGNPEFAHRIKAVVHMDMVGGGPETKAIFHVTRGPMSLPSVVHDVAWSFAEWVNEETYKYAATGKSDYLMTSPEGGKDPLRAEYSAYTMGSDHDVYQDSSFGIPAIYLNDWPDRYIHTNLDSPANIDPTKLKRAAFIGAASAYFLAAQNDSDAQTFIAEWLVAKQGALQRELLLHAHERDLTTDEVSSTSLANCHYDLSIKEKIRAAMEALPNSGNSAKVELPDCTRISATQAPSEQKEMRELRFKRVPQPKGPMAVFGYDYFASNWAKKGYPDPPKLLEYEGLWGGGEEYAYEVLNFANRKNTLWDIRNGVSAEYGPVPAELILKYLRALEEIGVVEEVK
jgi:aminopeptidase YwaD